MAQAREVFNPYMQFVGAFVPNWLAGRKEVTQGAKLAYGFLCQHAGKQGRCYPRQRILAAELGVGERQVRAYLEELESADLIGIQQQGLRRANRYVFYRHAWMEGGPRRHLCPQPDRNLAAALDRKPVASPDRHPASAPLEVETREREKEEVESPHNPPVGGECVNDPQDAHSSIHSQAGEIYQVYPKKAGKPAALRAIRRALRSDTFDHLLERTRLFASTYKGEPRYIPNPAKWFGEERFNDDPATWQRPATDSICRRTPAVIRPSSFKTGLSTL